MIFREKKSLITFNDVINNLFGKKIVLERPHDMFITFAGN